MERMKKLPVVEVVFDFRGETRDKKTGVPNGKTGTVSVRVYENRKYKVISTGVRVLPSEWSDEYYVVKREDALQLNNKIREQVKKCRDKIIAANEHDEQIPGTKMLKVDRSVASWLAFVEDEMKRRDMGDGTRKHHMTMYKSLVAFGKMLKYEDVKQSVIREWLADIRTRTVTKIVDGEVVEMKIGQAAVHNYWKRFKVYVSLAIMRGYLPANVLAGIKVDRGEDAEREHLSDEEIERWCLTPMPNCHMKDARDRFIVQMGTGLAYADLMEYDFTRHEVVNGNVVLSGRRVKTRKPYFIVVLPMAVEVLERWGWVIPKISNVDYNKFLKKVALRCGIDKRITSHVARHTYACYCLRHGVRMEVVQRTLGHTKIGTTQIYAKLVDMDVLDAFKKMK